MKSNMKIFDDKINELNQLKKKLMIVSLSSLIT